MVSAKWQQVRGTAEQKLLYEIASLISIIRNSDKHRKAYVVLGGTGFSRGARSFLLHNKHLEVLADGYPVEVISLEGFLARANKGEL
ncbi:PD-(D/E)XK nuclease superfamily protein [Desulfofundulus thermocisternus]|uniref:PD-(D/E)XK nuclease superfamily protein n=1 Tax=Desulfofundulus thermocisternus TaxID=42471 RepID=UPI002877B369|nr:PD-(D/E)XK nuclease superfamily protein [Desulfofundulus thermocisternus]